MPATEVEWMPFARTGEPGGDAICSQRGTWRRICSRTITWRDAVCSRRYTWRQYRLLTQGNLLWNGRERRWGSACFTLTGSTPACGLRIWSPRALPCAASSRLGGLRPVLGPSTWREETEGDCPLWPLGSGQLGPSPTPRKRAGTARGVAPGAAWGTSWRGRQTRHLRGQGGPLHLPTHSRQRCSRRSAIWLARAEGRAAPNSFPVSPRLPVPRPRARSRVQSPRLRFAAIREAAALQGFAKPLRTASPASRRSSLTWTPPQPSGEKRGGQGGASFRCADPKARVLRKPRASTEGPAPRRLTPCPAEGPLPRGRGRGELSGTWGWGGRKRFV